MSPERPSGSGQETLAALSVGEVALLQVVGDDLGGVRQGSDRYGSTSSSVLA